MIGLDVPGPGILVRQAIFSVSDHVTGKFFSVLVAVPSPPRKRVQSSARLALVRKPRKTVRPITRGSMGFESFSNGMETSGVTNQASKIMSQKCVLFAKRKQLLTSDS